MRCRKSKTLSWLLVVLFFSCLVPSSLFSSVDQPEEMTLATGQELPILPAMPTPKPLDSAPLISQLAETLQAWVTWYKLDFTPWHQKLMTSFRNLKDSSRKRYEQTQKTIEAKDAVISALRLENSILRIQVLDAHTSAAIGWSAAGISGLVNIIQAGISLIPK